MADVVDPVTRSRMMSGIKCKNTRPEMLVRRGLFAKGWRYRLHGKNLPGKPDIVFTRRKTVIFINGCFWHGHNCVDFRLPKTRADFWRDKITANRARDNKSKLQLENMGYRVLTVWECALKGRRSLDFEVLMNQISEWLTFGSGSQTIEGNQDADKASN